MTGELFQTSQVLDLGYSHYLIFSFATIGIAWGAFNAVKVNSYEVKVTDLKVEQDKEGKRTEDDNKKACFAILNETATQVKDGAKQFLNKEYMMLTFFCIMFAGILICAVDMPWKDDNHYGHFPYTAVCFLVGAFTSMLAGYIGMMVATTANMKVTALCNKEGDEGLNAGFLAAFQGGQVLGFCLVGIALMVLEILILIFKNQVMNHYGHEITKEQLQHQTQVLFEMISGYGLGGSTVALFGRVGGGIYTKAADVGADLAGKVISGLEEDSPLNPGTIADNVGDNVGDIAGMGADLFGSLAESTCAALVVSSTSWNLISTPGAVYFPLMVTAVGIGASFICVQFAHIAGEKPMKKLRYQLYISTFLMTVAVLPLIYMLPEELNIQFAGQTFRGARFEIYGCVMLGLWSGLFIGLITEYYTSHDYRPTRELAHSCRFSAASNVIKGLALGYESCIIPICCLAVTVLLSFTWAAMYGVALAALGMLGCLPVCLAVDGYGPISDNAGGLAEMACIHSDVREKTDELDAAGNTTAAIGKGFAIGSACLVALALFGAYITRIADANPLAYNVNILEPYTFAGLLFGAMLPYAFSALTMTAVANAANAMIEEIKRQVGIMQSHVKDCHTVTGLGLVDVLNEVKEKSKDYPDSKACVAISTQSSLVYMIAPGCIVVLSPLVWGFVFGYQFVSGMLAGVITSGIQIAFSASNTGGAWDNCKKFIEAGQLLNKQTYDLIRDEQDKKEGEFHGKGTISYLDQLTKQQQEAIEPRVKAIFNAEREKDASYPEFKSIAFKKRDEEHKSAVTGDTVGDPLKDTSGPAINILIKLMAITSLVFGGFIYEYGGIVKKAMN